MVPHWHLAGHQIKENPHNECVREKKINQHECIHTEAKDPLGEGERGEALELQGEED